MHAPLFSTITLGTEILVSAAVFYTFYLGLKRNRFPYVIAGAAVLYETVFNISYMVSRVGVHTGHLEPPNVIALAAVHGILSLVMFLLLVVFFILAAVNSAKGRNFIGTHRRLSWLFLILWTVSVTSGMLLYIVEYVL